MTPNGTTDAWTVDSLGYDGELIAHLKKNGIDPDRTYPLDVLKNAVREELIKQLRNHGIRIDRKDGRDVFEAEGKSFYIEGDGFVQFPYDGPGDPWDDPDCSYVDITRTPKAYDRISVSRTQLTDELWAVTLNDEEKRKRDDLCRHMLS